MKDHDNCPECGARPAEDCICDDLNHDTAPQEPRGHTLRALAQVIGVSPATLSRIASRSDMSVDTLLRLADRYDYELAVQLRAFIDYMVARLRRRSAGKGIA